MANELILAIDAGSSSIRAALFDAGGQCRGQASRPIRVVNQPPFSEADPDSIWSAVLGAVRELDADPGRIAAVGVTAALGLVLADQSGAPVAPVCTWQDRRAAEETTQIDSRCGSRAIYRATGRRIDPELTAPRLLWFRNRQPEAFAAARHVFSVKDWILFRLCGEAVCDPAGASYSLLFDVERGEWSGDLISALRLPAHIFPEVRDASDLAGYLTAAGASAIGLREGTPVVVGGPDGTVGGIGGGMVEPGIAVDVMGTTDVVFACVERPFFDPARRLVLNRFPVGSAWSIGGPMAATGGAIAWLAGLLGSDLATLTAEAAAIPAGSEGLLFSPVLAGSRTPRWDAAERGGLGRLSMDHGRAHLFRAALEGAAFEVADVFEALEAAGTPVREIRAVGGGTESRLWLEIRAAALGRPLLVPEVVEASALGTAMLAAVGVGLHADLRTASDMMVRVRERIEPAAGTVALYREAKQRYAAFRDSLANLPAGDGGSI